MKPDLHLRRATHVAPAGQWPLRAAIASVTLAFNERHRRRLHMTDDAGEPFLLDLARPAVLADGDGLVLESGGVIRVRAALESVADISAPTPQEKVRLAWHVGNRHTPIEVLSNGNIRVRDDPVLVDMLIRLGACVVRRNAAFSPETGAYAVQDSHESGHQHNR